MTCVEPPSISRPPSQNLTPGGETRERAVALLGFQGEATVRGEAASPFRGSAVSSFARFSRLREGGQEVPTPRLVRGESNTGTVRGKFRGSGSQKYGLTVSCERSFNIRPRGTDLRVRACYFPPTESTRVESAAGFCACVVGAHVEFRLSPKIQQRERNGHVRFSCSHKSIQCYQRTCRRCQRRSRTEEEAFGQIDRTYSSCPNSGKREGVSICRGLPNGRESSWPRPFARNTRGRVDVGLERSLLRRAPNLPLRPVVFSSAPLARKNIYYCNLRFRVALNFSSLLITNWFFPTKTVIDSCLLTAR